MVDSLDNMPAWMVAEDIISKSERVLMESALELLRVQIKSGAIKLDGNIPVSSEVNAEAERDLFMMEKLLLDEENLRLRYENLVNAVEQGSEKDIHIVERIEEIKKFLLAVSQMSLTVGYAKVFRAWFADAGKMMSANDPAEILSNTAYGRHERIEALGFVVGSRSFMGSEAFMPGEADILRRAHSMLQKGQSKEVLGSSG